MDQNMELCKQMAAYYQGQPRYINHFLKVYGYAKAIGGLEGLDKNTQFILEAAALVHDIGIKPALEKYGSSSGKYQEIEGPAQAQALLRGLQYPEKVVERVAYLVGHHHTYQDIQGLDYQILVEADFLVNIYEEEMGKDEILSVRKNIFRTAAGKYYFDTLFLME